MPQQHPVRSSALEHGRPDASMSLLTNVMNHSLDDGYVEAAARRGTESWSGPPRTLRAKLGLAAGLVLVSLVVTLGAVQARFEAPTIARERQELIDRVEEGDRNADALQRSVNALREEVARMQDRALREHGGERNELVALLAGAVPIEGPGIRLIVDDAKETAGSGSGGPRQGSSFSDSGRIRDRDLQRVVNGLWESGAEAIAINGQRLTSLSAIRAAGDAILVDNKPLGPPYTLLAVGDGQRLSSRFQNSDDGRYLHVLQEEYGIRTGISVRDRVQLPAASGLIIRTADPVETGEGSTS